MKQIESRNNPIIKKALKVLNGSNSEGLIMVEGHKLLGEALKSGAKPEMLFVTSEEALRDKTDLEDRCYIISRGLLRELSTVQTPNEILAYLTPAPSPSLDKLVKKAGMLVILDRLQDPGNIGTIMRTSEAMGASGIILLEGSCNANNHKVIRAAMGSSFRLPIVSNVNTENLFTILNKNGYMTICADMEGTKLPGFKFAEKSALFMGQEGRGLSDYIMNNCKQTVAIPMYGQVESLNVATSTAMCLYEWARNKSV